MKACARLRPFLALNPCMMERSFSLSVPDSQSKYFETMIKRLPFLSNPYLMRLFRYLPPYKGYLVLAAIAMVVGGGASSLIAMMLGRLTDMGFYDKNPDVLYWAPLALVGISIIYGGSQFLSAFWLAKVSQSILLDLRQTMFDRLIAWGDWSFQANRCGTIQSKFINEAAVALGGAASVMTTIIRDSIQIVCLIGVLVYHNWKLTLITFVIAPALAAVLRWVNKRIKSLTKQTQARFGSLITVIQDAYNGSRIMKIYNAGAYESQRFSAVNTELARLTLKANKVVAAGTPLTQLITMSGVSVVIVFALMQAQQDIITIGEFTTFLSALLLLMNPVRHLSNMNGTTAAMTAAAESLFTFLDEEPERDPGTKDLGTVQGAIRFEDVSYRYPDSDKWALKHFTLDVKPGEVIALVGASGAGKSTVINLLPRFLIPTSGKIYFDGIAQDDVTLASLRSQMALVSQEVTVFDDTLAGNIAYGCADRVSREQIEAAAQAAALGSMIASLPDGLDTQAGANGSALSGGQRQRISIARAILKNAPILLLDEATSALDTESEKHIQHSLQTLMKGRTTFVVAHRLSTIENADRIIVMKDGEVVEVGTHKALLAQGGAYANLYNVQFSGKPIESEATPSPVTA